MFLADDVNTGAGPGWLGPVSGQFEQVRYSVGDDQRPFILTGDLEAGISGGSLLLFPQLSPTEITGVQTTLAACRAYREAYPEGVECRDADWNIVE